MSSSFRLGFLCCLCSYIVWGSLPLYFRVLDHIPPEKMLSHRIIWSVPTGLILFLIAKNWRHLRAALTRRHVLWLSVSGLLIGFNWLIYIWAIGQERVLEASLGYYMIPLMSVLFGAFSFKESLRPAQWMSVGLAGVGVAIMTFALGYFPWVALVLCLTFEFYSIIHKKVEVDGRAGFLVEAAILTPLALLWLLWWVSHPHGSWFGNGGWDIAWLMAAGPITAIPLILFSMATKRLRFTTIGMMQYIGPTLQFLISVFIFNEAFGLVHAVAFGFIWTALIVFSIDSVLGDIKARRLAQSASAAE